MENTLPLLLATISANDAAPADRVSRRILNALTARACRYVRMYETEQRVGNVDLVFGPNWHGPAVASIIRESEIQRSLACDEQRAVAEAIRNHRQEAA